MWELDYKAEYLRIDAFEPRCWRRLLRVLWTASPAIQLFNHKRIQSWIFMLGLILKLKLQYFGHLMRRTVSLAKTLMLGKFEGRRKKGWQRMRWLEGITDSMDLSLRKLRELVLDRKAWRATGRRVRKSRTWLSYWTELK